MYRSLLCFVGFLLLFTGEVCAEALVSVADFESVDLFPPASQFGGSGVSDGSNGIDVFVEAVNFTAGGVVGEVVQFPERLPQPFPNNSGAYLAHGSPFLTSFVPDGTKGFYLRAGSHGSFGDLFDFVSMDISNFIRTPSLVFEYRPATVQLSTSSAPAPYTRGAPANGWIGVSTPGNLTDVPGEIQFETVDLVDSTDPTFPADQFRGMRSAFIGLDDVRGIDNVKVRWSRENFNAPTTVNILERELSGPGIMAQGTAVFHRPSAEASGSDGPVVVTSTERRVFSWDEDTQASSGFPLRVAGELAFHHVVENGGFIDVQWSHSIQRIGGGFTASGGGGVSVSTDPGHRIDDTYSTLTTQFRQLPTGFITPGAEYELITTLTVTADPRGGYAAIFFDRGWEVRIAGIYVPEPATLLLAVTLLLAGLIAPTRPRRMTPVRESVLA